MRYLKYLKYLLRHKWFVMLECFKEGLFWLGLTHDLSKFSPKRDRFFETREWYKANGRKMQLHNETRKEIERRIKTIKKKMEEMYE